MSYRVAFLTQAQQDMDDIEAYLSQFYPGTVHRFFEKLKKQVLILEQMPYSCPSYEDDAYFRKVVVEEYLLFYSVDETERRVVVHRIFHVSRDISRQIMSKDNNGKGSEF